MNSKSQFVLLGQRRFAPLLWVQFLGAANDNVFKFAFTLLATYSAASWGHVDPNLAGFLIAGLFIVPFMLFSATSGQLADKLEKSWFMRRIKEAKIGSSPGSAAGECGTNCAASRPSSATVRPTAAVAAAADQRSDRWNSSIWTRRHSSRSLLRAPRVMVRAGAATGCVTCSPAAAKRRLND